MSEHAKDLSERILDVMKDASVEDAVKAMGVIMTRTAMTSPAHAAFLRQKLGVIEAAIELIKHGDVVPLKIVREEP